MLINVYQEQNHNLIAKWVAKIAYLKIGFFQGNFVNLLSQNLEIISQPN